MTVASQKWKCGRRYLVGYVGVIGKQEGIDYLLRSVRYLVFDKKRVDTHFVVMGSGPSLQDAQRDATIIGDEDPGFAGILFNLRTGERRASLAR
jgi:glycosyltransferase involved in cell wall biosynthesis